MSSLTLGKSILSFVSLVTGIGPYMADWSATHVFNPNWPPHARFHNGQTMTTGLFLSLLTFYHLYRTPSFPPQKQHRTFAIHFKLQDINLALLFQHIYYIPALSGSLYPGALWIDPEFGEGRPQLYGFSALLLVSWVGWWIERRRLVKDMLGAGVNDK